MGYTKKATAAANAVLTVTRVTNSAMTITTTAPVTGTAVTVVARMATCTNINTASNAHVWILTSRHQNAQSKNSRVMVSATMKTTLQLVILMATTAVVPANTGPAITRINTNFARNASVWNHELLKLNFSARFLHRIMLMTLLFRMCNLLVSLASHHTFI